MRRTLLLIPSLLVWIAAHQFANGITQNAAFNLWFDADPPRVFASMTEIGGMHYRNSVHPLLIPLTLPWVALLHGVLRVQALEAVRLILAANAGLWAALVYAVLRAQGHQKHDALLFTLLAGSTAAALCWLPMLESYPLGSVTLLLPLWLLARNSSRRWITAANVLGLGVTLTNGMSGVITTLLAFRPREALRILAWSALLLGGLALGTRLVAPHVSGVKTLSEERDYLFRQHPAQAIASFFSHSVVLPQPEWKPIMTPHGPQHILRVQQASVLGSPLEIIARFMWLALLSLGGITTVREARQGDRNALALALLVLGQFALHIAYGIETFLYALHFAPLLVLVAAYGLKSEHIKIVRNISWGLIPLLWASNFPRWLWALYEFNSRIS